MGKILKIVLFAVTVLIVLLCVGISLTIGWRPFIGPRARPLTNRTFESTPQRQARGIDDAVDAAEAVEPALVVGMELHAEQRRVAGR